MKKKSKASKTDLLPTQSVVASPVAAELQQIFEAVTGRGGKLSYNDNTGELKASVVKDGFAYFVEKKYVGLATIQTRVASPVGNSKEERKQHVIELAKAYPKASQTALAEMAGVSQGTVSTYIREAKDDGQL